MPYHFNSTPLEPGSIIRPGNWGRIIRLYGWSHGRAAHETVLEQVRLAEFPERPSRLDCSFFFDDVAEAQFYRRSDHIRAMMILYEVELLCASAVQHATDWRNVSPNGSLDHEWARRYWRGEFLPPQDGQHGREILAVTPLKIVRQID